MEMNGNTDCNHSKFEFVGKKKLLNDHLEVYNKIRKGNINFTSTTCKPSTTTYDYYMQFREGLIGKAKYFYESENENLVLFEKIKVINEFHQFLEISEFESKLLIDIK